MKKISIIKRDTQNNDNKFWKSKTPEERLSAVEFLREQCFIIQGYDRLPSIVRKITIRESDGENSS
jgi:hypothetical protein